MEELRGWEEGRKAVSSRFKVQGSRFSDLKVQSDQRSMTRFSDLKVQSDKRSMTRFSDQGQSDQRSMTRFKVSGSQPSVVELGASPLNLELRLCRVEL